MVAIAALWVHAPSLSRTGAVDAASIAVLPFQDLSGDRDKEGEILSDGLTEELIESRAHPPSACGGASVGIFLSGQSCGCTQSGSGDERTQHIGREHPDL